MHSYFQSRPQGYRSFCVNLPPVMKICSKKINEFDFEIKFILNRKLMRLCGSKFRGDALDYGPSMGTQLDSEIIQHSTRLPASDVTVKNFVWTCWHGYHSDVRIRELVLFDWPTQKDLRFASLLRSSISFISCIYSKLVANTVFKR